MGIPVNKMTPDYIEGLVESYSFSQPVGSTLTVCTLVLTNGCVVVGTSNVIDPANYDGVLGQSAALANTKGKLYELEGYALKRERTALINKAAEAAHEANREYCRSLGDHSQPRWSEALNWQKDSAIKGVETIMRNPNTQPHEGHEAWLNHKVQDGWVYGTEKCEVRKTHPCIVLYGDLPEAQREKDEIFIETVREVLGFE